MAQPVLVNRYVLMAPLGRGGFGEVWRATGPGGVAPARQNHPPPPAHEARVRAEQGQGAVKG